VSIRNYAKDATLAVGDEQHLTFQDGDGPPWCDLHVPKYDEESADEVAIEIEREKRSGHCEG
jgi:hypothetical protein